MRNNRKGIKSAVRRVLLVSVATVMTAAGGVALAGVVSGTPSPAPSFKGPVFAIAHRGDVVYVGGSFTGVVIGTKTILRDRLAAFNARTGTLLDWNPGADSTVRALAVDGNTVYAAGDFAKVASVNRKKLASIDATTGALGAVNVALAGTPNTLAVGNGRLYIGGKLTAVGGATRANLGAVTLATGKLDTGWKPTTDNTVNAIAVNGTRVYVGGSFHKANNVSSTLRLVAVDGASGALVKGFVTKPISQVFGLAINGAGVTAALGGKGGRAIAYGADGKTKWTRVFDGDAQAIAVLDGTTYVGGHFDNACLTSNNGDQGACSDGSVPRIKLAAVDADGNLVSGWAPQANGVVGVRVMATNPAINLLSVGGDFTVVNNTNQKRYVSFGGPAGPPPVVPPVPSPFVASYNFDSTVADGTFDDGSGKGHLLKAMSTNGGVVESVTHGLGQAVSFPPKCAGTDCKRVVLQSADAADLNPGTKDLKYGAQVLLSPAETSTGENVLQKGYSTNGGQYKLQVDGVSGKPTCVMSDKSSTKIYQGKSTLSVADGAWHTLECRRTGTSLTIYVDGIPGTVVGALPADLSVVTTQPLSLGGKGTGADNDQFHGSIDDAWISIG